MRLAGLYEHRPGEGAEDLRYLADRGAVTRAGRPAVWAAVGPALEAMEAFAPDPLPPRFWAKVRKDEGSGCWIWIGALAGPGEQYGYIRVDGKSVRAHRFAYEAVVGPIPAGLQLDHLCRTRACVNPAHLEPVTPRVNQLRGETLAARATAKTHCPRGHPYDAENTAIYNGKRTCKACNRIKAREHYYAKRRKPHLRG